MDILGTFFSHPSGPVGVIINTLVFDTYTSVMNCCLRRVNHWCTNYEETLVTMTGIMMMH